MRYGDAWLPVSRNPGKLEADIAELREIADEAGRPTPQVAVLSPLPLDDGEAAKERLEAYAEIGVSRLAHATVYETSDDFERALEALIRAAESQLRRS